MNKAAQIVEAQKLIARIIDDEVYDEYIPEVCNNAWNILNKVVSQLLKEEFE